MSVTSIARKDQPDNRAALRAASAAAATARGAVTKAESAIERAERLVAENQTRLASATKAVVDAQSEDAKRLASILAAGGTSPTLRAARQARADEAERADDVEAAKSALASLREDLTEAERDVAAAGRAVDASLAETLKPVALLLIEKAREHHQKFVATSEALAPIVRLFTAWNGGEIMQQANRIGTPSEAAAQASMATGKRWQAAIAALREDADAELPDLGD